MERRRYTPTEYISKLKKLENTSAAAAGLMIGVGVGGWVALGMDPYVAIGFTLSGAGIGFDGANTVLKRERFEETGI